MISKATPAFCGIIPYFISIVKKWPFPFTQIDGVCLKPKGNPGQKEKQGEFSAKPKRCSYKTALPFSVTLLAEYHANSIRLRRVLLLRSDIRLTPSDIAALTPICVQSRVFRANRISLKPQGFNITVAVRQYHSLRQQRISPFWLGLLCLEKTIKFSTLVSKWKYFVTYQEIILSVC